MKKKEKLAAQLKDIPTDIIELKGKKACPTYHKK